MITRYTRPEMGEAWSAQARFGCLLEVEVAVAAAQSERGMIPAKAYREIKSRAKFDVARIAELERTTKHDVIAFVTCVAESVGPAGRYLHYGLTSSDVLDTALSLQVRRATAVLSQSFDRLQSTLDTLVKRHARTLCAGRTHGVHAEATTFGLKLAGHAAEFARARARVDRATAAFAIAKLSGAVGTYATQPPEIERAVGKALNLTPETVATQVIPRDRHAEVMWALAITGAAVERLSVELRHLQRTEVAEVIENFTPGQKGSSAMPHKKNPISAENLTGLARVLRANAGAALENVALWHERDISHSSVERIVLPDSFILADYALDRLAGVLDKLYVDEARMKANMALSQGQLFSSQVMLAMIDQGLSREEAYRIVQRVCHDLKPGDALEDRLSADSEAGRVLTPRALREIFSGKAIGKSIDLILKATLEPKRARRAPR